MVSGSEVILDKWLFVAPFGVTGRVGIEGEDYDPPTRNAHKSHGPHQK